LPALVTTALVTTAPVSAATKRPRRVSAAKAEEKRRAKVAELKLQEEAMEEAEQEDEYNGGDGFTRKFFTHFSDGEEAESGDGAYGLARKRAKSEATSVELSSTLPLTGPSANAPQPLQLPAPPDTATWTA